MDTVRKTIIVVATLTAIAILIPIIITFVSGFAIGISGH